MQSDTTVAQFSPHHSRCGWRHRLPRFAHRCVLAGMALLLLVGTVQVKGADLWVADPNMPVTKDAAPPAAPERTVVLVAPRNGTVSGVVVARSETPITALTVSVSDLTAKDGAGMIVKAGIQLRFGTPKTELCPSPTVTPLGYTGPVKPDWTTPEKAFINTLSPTLIPGEKVQPVWITVRVPADTKPGDYTGTLTLSGNAAGTIPIQLKVSTFTLPAPKDYVEWLSFSESPDTVAYRYNVPLYSDEHFKLLEKSYELIGQLGNHVLYVPVLEKSVFGNEHSVVQWQKTGDKLTPDFTQFDRLFALYVKHCGKPRVIIVQLWESAVGNPKKNIKQVPITLAGKLPETFEADVYPANREAWVAVLKGFEDRIQKAELKPETLVLGTAWDAYPTKEQFAFFKEIAPATGWARFCHGYGGTGMGNGGNPVYMELPDSGADEKKPIRPISNGWVMNTVRDTHGVESAPFIFRYCPDMARGSNRGSRGFARLGIDFWPVIQPGQKVLYVPNDPRWRPRYMDFIHRFKEFSDIGRLYRSYTAAVTVPGPDGALATAQFEMLREGIQETEARIALEQALLARQLTDPLKSEVETMLMERAKRTNAACKTHYQTADPQWQAHSEKLYDAAGIAQRQSADK